MEISDSAGMRRMLNSARVLWGIAVLVGAAGALQVLLLPINLDSAWLLYVAGKALEGAKPYVAYIETNPPLIILLSMPAAFVAEVPGVSSVAAFKAQTLLVGALSLWLCGLLLRALPHVSGTSRAYVMVVLVYAYLVQIGVNAGQREHVLLMALCPYLILSAARLARATVGGRLAVVVGLSAGMGFALKPHFLLVWLALEVSLHAALGFQQWSRRPELIAVAGTFAGYAVAILLIFPEYITLARDVLVRVYPHFYSRRWDWVIFSRNSLACAAALGLYLVYRPRGVLAPFARTVATALAPLVLVVWVQQRGWEYHWYAAMAMALILVGLCLHDYPDRASSIPTIQRLARAVFVGGLVVSGFLHAQQAPNAKTTPEAKATSRMVEIVERHAPGGSIAVLSLRLQEVFPLVTYADVDYNLRFVPLWPLVGVLEARFKAVERGSQPPDVADIERFLIDGVASDFTVRPADLVILDTWPLITDYGRARIDLIAYFSADERFRRAIAQYEFLLADENRIVLKRVIGRGSPDA